MTVLAILGGVVLLVVGLVLAILRERMLPPMRRLQSRFYGQRLSEKTGTQLTASYLRFIGTILAVCGILLILVAALGGFRPAA
ncbi:hypothetical protein BH09ACT1_BH09ACT1_23620 [soil metagenome]